MLEAVPVIRITIVQQFGLYGTLEYSRLGSDIPKINGQSSSVAARVYAARVDIQTEFFNLQTDKGKIDMRTLLVLVILMLAAPAVSQTEAPLTNAEIVKLCKAELGDEIVIAKIEGAGKTAFVLDTDNLIELKNAGVSQPVISAMLRKASGRTAAPHAAGALPSGAPPQAYPQVSSQQDDPPLLEASDGTRPLVVGASRFNATGFGPIKLVHLELAGYTSNIRTLDTSPVLVVQFNYDPTTFFFIVQTDPDKGDNTRSVKMGSAMQRLKKMFQDNPRYYPDAGHTVPYNAEQSSPGVWRISPKNEMPPGEYGLYFSSDFTSKYRGTDSAIYDFAVVAPDTPPSP